MQNPIARLWKRQPKALDLNRVTNSLGTIPFNTLHTLTHMQSDDYENGYSSIRWIAKRFFTIKPYAIDEKGEKLEQTPNVVQLLSRPNQDMSGVKFRDAMAVMNMVHDKTYILVWERRGNEVIPATENVREDTIAGFTFLEGVFESVEDGQVVYNTTFGNTPTKFYRHQVITDYEVNPRNLSQGYSPSQAAKRWKTIDDYIADYQRGFFQNGAVPSGMFLVVAPTATEYEDIVGKLKEKHQGAGKNNGVVYSHVPTDPTTGKTEQASITWVPFNVSNKDMALKDLFEQANSKIDAVYGVSKFLRMMDDSAPNRSVAQTIEKMAVEDVVRPFAIQRWSQFQHELNRITGGLGYAITFDLETPNISEDEEAEARTDLTRVQALQTLTLGGYTLDSVVEALGLPERFKALEVGSSTAIQDDKVDIDDGDNEELPVNPIAKLLPEVKAQISTRDYPDLYEGTDIDPSDLGCIMVDVEPLKILSVVDGGEADLVEETDRHEHQMGAVAEVEPHVTLLYGLLENGNIWKDKVDSLLDGWELDTVKIEEVSYFNLPDSYAIIGHIEKTTDLLDGHDRLTLLPHINTFSTYKPHMTLAYIKKEADLGKWLTSLNEEYAGKELTVTGINYGDLPEDDDDTPSGTKAMLKGEATGANPKAELTDEERIYEAAKSFMRSQIDLAIAELDEEVVAQEPTDDQLDAFVVAMMAVITGILIAYGEEGYATGATIAGLTLSELRGFNLPELAEDGYAAYLRGVGQSYGNDTAESLRKTLLQARDEGLDLRQTKERLRGVLDTDEWRIERIARTELNHAQGIGKLEGFKELRNQVGGTWEKTISHEGVVDPCPLCQSFEGVWTDIDQPLWDEGDSQTTTNDKGETVVFVNDWYANESHDYHPNGRGELVFRMVEIV